MRVSEGRLDLTSVGINREVVITTGNYDAVLSQTDGDVIQEDVTFDPGAGQTLTTRDGSVYEYWLNLAALSPNSLYIVLVTQIREAGMPGWQITDATPEVLGRTLGK